jgi:hypothetical protein
VNTPHDQRKARKDRNANFGFAGSAAFAFFVYVIITVALTWPVVRGITRDVPSDLGDPLFAMWVMSWDATHLGAGWWNANIFYPHPLALAYSEHFLPQALQVLPIYLVTKNPILCYNLVFLSTFALSGLGMFLFARELTGSREGAFVAGLAYAFAPYRVASLPHLQVLSSAWLPFVLFGFRRYFSTGKSGPVVGAVTAWVVQNLSCGYYFLYFSPVIALYVAWEITVRRLWSNARVLAAIAAAFAATAMLTVPFMLPYLALRDLGFSPRGAREVDRFAADVYSYLTAAPNLHVWGSIARAWPKPESALFPGITVVALAAVAVVRAWREARFAAWFTAAAVAAKMIALALLFGWTLRLPMLQVTSVGRTILVAAALAVVALGCSRDVRSAVWRWLQQPAAILWLLTVFGAALSLGARISAKGRVVLESAPYGLFYRFVPGFDGLRVPSRFGMVVAFGLAALAALGVAAIRDERRRMRLALLAGALIAVEFLAVPLPINGNSTTYERPGLAPLPDGIDTGAGAPPVYRFVASLAAPAAILELPLGEPAFDIRYMFYSTLHWKPLVNGYSGGEPADYALLDTRLQDFSTQPDRAWRALVDSKATHVIVHEAFYTGEAGSRISEWIRGSGGREVAAFGSDRVFEIVSSR